MKIGVLGATGRVGRLIVEELQSGNWPDMAWEKNPQQADMLIDFTAPEATRKHLESLNKPIVIGTTGLDTDCHAFMEQAAKKHPILYATNMSLGVTLLNALVEQAATRLDWDIEIHEIHHRHKKDAPSGTALSLGQAATKARGRNLEDCAIYARHGQTGERTPGSIGFSVQRGGDVIGEHCVGFFGAGEQLRLTHISNDRRLYATGALKAAHWLSDKKSGLYTMRDVLGF